MNIKDRSTNAKRNRAKAAPDDASGKRHHGTDGGKRRFFDTLKENRVGRRTILDFSVMDNIGNVY